ncbi:MAG: hypothetical protein AB2L13_20980 [Spirochaetota bacterium]
MEKTCPISSVASFTRLDCTREGCAWWVRVPTIESGHFDEGCALAILAMKNGEGRVLV